MPRHSLFPNSVTIHYTSNTHNHNMTLPVGVVAGSAPGWTLPQRDASTIDWRTAVDDFCDLLKTLFDTSATFNYAELFTYEATDSPAEFLAAHVIDIAGTHGGSAVPFVQNVYPFKAVGGNSLRLSLMESTLVENRHLPIAATNAEEIAIADFILSADGWIITRGGTYPDVSLGVTSKVNDKLRKRYLLDS